jgi:ketosteroid isomerase-like protein
VATNYRDGTCEFEEVARYATPNLGCLFHIERSESKIGENTEPSRITLRITIIYRREEDGWKIVLRHADPIMKPRSIDPIIEK